MGVRDRKSRLHKQPDRRADIQLPVADCQFVGILRPDIPDTQPAPKQVCRHCRIGNKEMYIFSVLFFQFRKTLLFQQDAVIDDADIVRQQRVCLVLAVWLLIWGVIRNFIGI